MPDDDGDDGGASTVMSQSDLASVAGGSDAGGGRGGGDSAPPTRQSARSSSRRSSVSSAGSTTASGKGKEDDVTLNVHHFEQLVRIYLMRAKMAATTAAKTEFCLVAHPHGAIWQLAAATAIAKAAADAAEADEDAADADAAAAAEAARLGPAYALPRVPQLGGVGAVADAARRDEGDRQRKRDLGGRAPHRAAHGVLP